MSEEQEKDPQLEYFKSEIINHLEGLMKKEKAEKSKSVKSTEKASNFMLRVLDNETDVSVQLKQQSNVFKEHYGEYPNVLVASKETITKIANPGTNTVKAGSLELYTCEGEDFKNDTYELLSIKSEILEQNHFVYPLIDMKKTGETIKRLMDENGITVKDLQQMLRLSSVQAIYYWLSGDKIPSIDNLCVLSHIFNVPIDDILSVKLLKED